MKPISTLDFLRPSQPRLLEEEQDDNAAIPNNPKGQYMQIFSYFFYLMFNFCFMLLLNASLCTIMQMVLYLA